MSPIEMKVDTFMRAMTADDPNTYEAAMAEIRMFVSAGQPKEIGATPDAGAEISQILLELGMPEHILGYQYTFEAIQLAVTNKDYINSITDKLYPEVAKIANSTKSRVERAIRHAIELVWDRGDLDVIKEYFGNTVNPTKGRPTNSEFIARVANVVRRRLKR